MAKHEGRRTTSKVTRPGYMASSVLRKKKQVANELVVAIVKDALIINVCACLMGLTIFLRMNKAVLRVFLVWADHWQSGYMRP